VQYLPVLEMELAFIVGYAMITLDEIAGQVQERLICTWSATRNWRIGIYELHFANQALIQQPSQSASELTFTRVLLVASLSVYSWLTRRPAEEGWGGRVKRPSYRLLYRRSCRHSCTDLRNRLFVTSNKSSYYDFFRNIL
jgi:hypothetical protein